MKAYKQLDTNDCGISVTQSLINHFYKKECSREEICKKANLTEKGLSIFELERLNLHFGIFLDSYEMSFEEFIEWETKNYFVLLLSVNSFFHYCIAKKAKNQLIIYDSNKGKRIVEINEIKNNFLNIVIQASKFEKSNIKINLAKNKFSLLEWKKIFFVSLVEILLLFFAFLNAKINKLIFGEILNSQNFYNLGGVLFIGIFFIFNWTCFTFFRGLIKVKYKKYFLKKHYQIVLDSLKNKKNYFYQKIGGNSFLYLQNHLQIISNFIVEYFAQIVSSLFAIILISFYFLIWNDKFLWLIFIFSCLQMIYCFASFKFNKQNINKRILNLNDEQKRWVELDIFLKNECNLEKLKILTHDLKNSVLKKINFEERIFFKKLFLEKINFLIFHLGTILLYIYGVFLHFENHINIEQLFFCSYIYFYLNSFISKLISASQEYSQFQVSKNAFFNICNIEKLDELNSIEWSFPKLINIKHLNFEHDEKKIFSNLSLIFKNSTFLKGKSGSGKTTLYKLIANKLFLNNDAIFLDGIGINQINQYQFNKNVIYQNSNSHLSYFDWNKILNNISKDDLNEIISLFDLEIKSDINFDNLSSGQKQFLNILKLISFEKKILLLDEVTSHINKSNKKRIYQKLFPIILKKNFVICSEHDLSLSVYFDHLIDLDKR